MKCSLCKHGDMQPGRATITLSRAGITVVFQDVPAEICTHCGEQFVDAATTAQLIQQADKAVSAGVQVEVRSYKAA